MALQPEEKRRFPRLKRQIPLRYQIRGVSEYSNNIANNISVGGVGFINDRFIPPSTKLMLEILIPSRILNPIGRVAWSVNLPHSDQYSVGIEFLEMEESQRKHLQDYMEMQLV